MTEKEKNAIKPDRMGHRTRFSDSSMYDFVCIDCGATDDPYGDHGLDYRCPAERKR